MQLVTPSVVPTAVSTAIITCKIVFQTSFFIFFLVVQHLERDWAGVPPCRFPLRFLVVNFPFAVLNERQCKDTTFFSENNA